MHVWTAVLVEGPQLVWLAQDWLSIGLVLVAMAQIFFAVFYCLSLGIHYY